MTQNRQLGDLAQLVTVNTAASSIQVGNTTIHSNGVTVGNTSIHTTGIIVDGQFINNTSFPGTANNTSFVGSVSATNVVSNAQLQANVSTLQGQITSNSATAYSNAVSYVDGKSYVNTSQLSSNLANYVTTTNLTNNLANYQTTAGLLSNVATLTANNSLFLGGTAAASYQLNSTLNANIASYLPTYTGVVNGSSHTVGSAFTANSTVTNTVSLVVSTNTATIGTTFYSVANGNVGIGTSSPTVKLDVTGVIVSRSASGGYSSIFPGDPTNTGYFAAHDVSGVRQVYSGYVTSAAVYATWGETNKPMLFGTNNAERLRITSAGDVGIGTSSPGAKLTVRHDITAYGQVWSAFNGATFQNDCILGFNGYTYFGNFQANPLIFMTNNTERMRITSDGNVGIGQTSAPEKISVFSDTDNSAEIGRAHVGFMGHADFAGFSHVDMNATGNYALLQSAGGSTYLNSAAGTPIYFRQGNADKMILDASGRFGIGTSSPGHSLHVSGASASINVQDSGGAGAYITLTRGTGAFPASGAAAFSQFNGSLFIKNLDTGPIVFTTTSSDTERMRITSSGNVGIGTTSPSTFLEVSSGASQYPLTVNLLPSTHASSRRASIGIGDWYHLQDIFGNGTKDFSIYNFSSGLHGLTITTAGNVGVGGTTAAGYKLQVVGANTSAQIYASSSDASMSRIGLTNTNRHWSISNYGTSFSPNGSFAIADESAPAVRFRIDTSGAVTSLIDHRAPIFYDSDNTNYYINAAGYSKIYDVNVDSGYIYFQSTQHKRITSNDGGGNWNFRAGNLMDGGLLKHINNGVANSGAATITLTCDGAAGYISFLTAPIGANGATVTYSGSAYLDSLGTFGTNGDFRAPIFYDSNNTAFYVDPASTSVLNAATFAGVHTVNASGITTTANVNIGAAGELVIAAGAGIFANGGLGSAGEVLHSNGSSIYWATDDQGVTSVSGTSGRITSSGGTTPTIDLATAGAGAASYSSGISALTVDAYGRVTSVTGSASYATTTQLASYLPLSGGTMTGALNIGTSTNLSFGAAVRQMINLFNTDYAIGIQNNTQYYRSASRFSWHRGGVHSGTENDPGAGGTSAMTLDSSSNLTAVGSMRSPIFYDSNNTGFYVDPASTSFIHRLTIKPTDGDTTLRLYQYGGTSGSPSEIADWPHPVVSIRSFGDFYLQSMLSFGLPGDADYKTDDSVWNFKLNGVRSGGWDNNTGTSKTTTDSGVGLQLLGPGRLRIGSVNANDTYIRYNGIDLVRVSSMGGISGVGVKNGDGWSGLALSSDSNKTVILHYGASNDYALRFGRYSNNFGNWEANPFNMYMNDGYATASNSWRSPLFYDLNDTAYYCDPNSTSRFFAATFERPSFVPRYTVYLDATSNSRTSPSAFTKSYTASHVSFGSLLGFYFRGFGAGGSLMFEMSVTCSSATSVSSYLFHIDDNIYFFLNGSQIGSSTGAGTKNYALTWNLVQGTNTIQIVYNNSGGGAGDLGFMADFFQNGVTRFNPP